MKPFRPWSLSLFLLLMVKRVLYIITETITPSCHLPRCFGGTECQMLQAFIRLHVAFSKEIVQSYCGTSSLEVLGSVCLHPHKRKYHIEFSPKMISSCGKWEPLSQD